MLGSPTADVLVRIVVGQVSVRNLPILNGLLVVIAVLIIILVVCRVIFLRGGIVTSCSRSVHVLIARLIFFIPLCKNRICLSECCRCGVYCSPLIARLRLVLLVIVVIIVYISVNFVFLVV